MKKYYISLLFPLILSNCQPYTPYKPVKPQKVKFESTDCKNLLKLVKKDWKVHEENGTYIGTNDFTTIIGKDYRNCIRGLSREEIKQIFGVPNEDRKTGTTYYLSSSCLNVTSLTRDCYHLKFSYDKKGKVQSYRKRIYGIEN